MIRVRAKKSLGQHFLKDLNIAEQIANSLNLTENTNVLEIGPGMGVLTQFLLQNSYINLTAVELDRESVNYLKLKFPKLNLIEADFLKLDLNIIFHNQKFCIIGNYPYNISSQIIFKVLEYKNQIPICSGMIQKEVAERLTAKPKTKAYGILSVLLQTYYDIEYLFTVHNYVFDPPPKVESAVIRLKRNKTEKIDCNEVLFKQIVKTAFNQRRKQMRNSLQSLISNKKLLNEEIFKKRAEELSVNDFIYLTNLIEKNYV